MPLSMSAVLLSLFLNGKEKASKPYMKIEKISNGLLALLVSRIFSYAAAAPLTTSIISFVIAA